MQFTLLNPALLGSLPGPSSARALSSLRAPLRSALATASASASALAPPRAPVRAFASSPPARQLSGPTIQGRLASGRPTAGVLGRAGLGFAGLPKVSNPRGSETARLGSKVTVLAVFDFGIVILIHSLVTHPIRPDRPPHSSAGASQPSPTSAPSQPPPPPTPRQPPRPPPRPRPRPLCRPSPRRP